jgi:hypothetical protein
MKLSKLDAFVFCSAPIFASYMFFIPGVSIAEALMALSLLFRSLTGSLWQVKTLPIISLFFFFLLIHMLFMGVMGNELSVGYFRLMKFFIIVTFLLVVYEKVERNNLASILLFIVALNIAGFLFQYAVNLFSGFRFSLIIPFLPLVNTDLSIESINKVLTNDFRPGALFMEPAHLSYFLFFAGLFLHRLRVSHVQIILPCIFLTLFFTFSSFGFFAGLILLFLSYGYMSSKVKVLIFLVFILALPFVLGYLMELTLLLPQVARLLEPESVAVTGRLLGGVEKIEIMEGVNKTWGLGFGNFELGGFMSGITYLKVSFGTIGFTILAVIFLLITAVNYKLSYYFISLIIISLFSSLILTPFLLIALLPLFTEEKYEVH